MARYATPSQQQQRAPLRIHLVAGRKGVAGRILHRRLGDGWGEGPARVLRQHAGKGCEPKSKRGNSITVFGRGEGKGGNQMREEEEGR